MVEQEIGRVGEKKKECFLIWRRMRREEGLEEYGRMNGVVKR